MYGLAVTTTPQQFGNHVAVNSVADVEYLIKESEIEIGEPGRDFLLRVGEQMLAYRLRSTARRLPSSNRRRRDCR